MPLSEHMVVLFHQYTENTRFFSYLSADGLCDWGILLVISLEFQGNKASTAFYDTANKNFIQLFPLIFSAISQFVCNFPIDMVGECATILAVERIEC